MPRVDPVVLTHVLTAHGKYVGLRCPFVFKGQWAVEASIEITDGDRERWGTFDVRIVFPSSYPKGVPVLFEIGGRIKMVADWHICDDGSCCLGPWVSEMKKFSGGVNLADWLDRSAIPFLANHLYKERHGNYRNGEYSHGADGILEYYQEYWHSGLPSILHRLRQVTGLIRPEPLDVCFCGSKKLYAACHKLKSDFGGVPRDAYKRDLALLEAYALDLKTRPVAA